jgi:spore germination protein PE
MGHMSGRISIVNQILIYTNALGSIIQIGDTAMIKSRADVFAVQRQIPFYLGNEGDLTQFPIFNRPIPQPLPPRGVKVTTTHKGSNIKVKSIRIIGLSAASVFQVGSNRSIDLESRTKHIRQFVDI